MKNSARKKSIFTNDLGVCHICGTRLNIHKHEIYYGAFRKKSIEYGCIVGLCARHHNMSNDGVHFNHELDLKLKKECQRKFEKIHGREKFMEVFKKNYLWEEE